MDKVICAGNCIGRGHNRRANPTFGIDPLKHCNFYETEWFANGTVRLIKRRCGNFIGEIAQVNDAKYFENQVKLWEFYKNGAQTESNSNNQYWITQNNAKEMRNASSITIINARDHDHGVVHARGKEECDAE